MVPLATPADLGQAGEGIEESKALSLLDRASGIVRGHCEWQISHVTETMTTYGCGERHILLRTTHLLAVTAVTVDGEPVTDYRFSSAGVLTRDSGWRGAVAATVEHGYDPIPAEVQSAVCALALRSHLNPAGGEERLADHQSRYPAGLSAADEAILSRYQL